MVDGAARNALVTGANRGIGLGLARQYAADGWRVIATCRDANDADELIELAAKTANVSIEDLDLGSGASIEALAHRLGDQPIDLLINNAGTMGPLPLEEHIHKQLLGGIDYDLWAQVLLINTLGTVHLTESLLDNVAASEKKTIVTLSSTAGSIGESDRPAMAYTTSKAALNKAMTIVAKRTKDRGLIVSIVCPGHVKTRLGIGGAGVEIEDSVDGLKELIAGLKPEDSGTFRRYNGETVAW